MVLFSPHTMPHHVPVRDSWRPNDVAAAFRGLGLHADVVDERVFVVVPVLEVLDQQQIIAATTARELRRKTLGETTATLSFRDDQLIDNICIEFDIETVSSLTKYPDYSRLKKGLENCGYACGSESEIIQLYLPKDSDAFDLLAELETLQRRKEDLVAIADFEQAKTVLQQQGKLRAEIERKIREVTL